ncbi:peroxiredoxin [Pseudoalteromonas denitrificans]|jgi:thiol peroxidase|uniref:Thiol peroxidase, atypical 2-Cys peroxiredoxin n=1 Tax=Pseudoalteromonas denitrificans DSM 6059 TaxID=1123010 RepID=A0A1I1SRW9_9GAMM|nr:peroxiredoxin [Pseudoalteromonas denitrificans]SFD49062.1 thiol peroxidase, atypical 2-Cys peroxiredoxin [Pseudoalteromonas denitrificans DSM 6059]
MKKSIFSTFALVCSLNIIASESTFKITDLNAKLGDGAVVTLESKPFKLSGQTLQKGDLFPSLILKNKSYSDFDTSSLTGKVRIYNVVTSVDTPVCNQQIKALNAFMTTHNLNDIEVYAVSADTAFAQNRFKENNEITNDLMFLSDSIAHQFGNETGTLISSFGLLARTIIVVNKDNKVVHIQRVPELTTIPNLETAVAAAKQHSS